jgi:large subunit ribosomal protein L7/L12
LGTLPNRVVVEPILPPPPTAFDVVLDGIDAAKKLNVIRTVRELTGAGLAEAKGTVEAAPRVIREGLDKDAAEQLKAKLEAAGAKVTLKGI